jgi:hypothetical protein
LSNNKKKNFIVCGIIVLSLIAVNIIIFGLSKSDNPEAVVKRPDRPPLPVGRSVDRSREDQKFEQAYDKRNAEITPWIEGGTPPNPDNAALLYYQAFLLRPELNDLKTRGFYYGAKPDRKFRAYLGRCLPMIEIVEIASRMPNCTWGILPKHQLSQMAVNRELGHIAEILLVDARTLAADGNYRVALERCLTVLRIDRHLSEDPEMNVICPNSYTWFLETIQDLLGVVPPDADILTWFRGQLDVVKGPQPSFAKFVLTRIKPELTDALMYPPYLANLRKLILEQVSDKQVKKEVRNLTDEQLLLRINEELKYLINSIFRVLDSEEGTHQQKLTQMQQLIRNLTEIDDADPVVKYFLIDINMEGMINRYKSHVWYLARINSIKAAVEIYLIVAKTGQLPESLPNYLPKDPTTGRNFVYEITNEGCALRCQDEEFLGHRSRKLEFKVKK